MIGAIDTKGTPVERSNQTAAVRAGIGSDPGHGAVVPPIHLSTTYRWSGLREPRSFEYSRSGNPSRALLEQALAELDGAAGAVVTGSGMAAITTCLVALAGRDARVVAPHDAYGGTWRVLDALRDRLGFELHLVDLTASGAPQRVRELSPSLLIVETPSNPLLGISDIAALSEAAHAGGGVVVVDNTFCSPAVQRPLALGADAVVQSTTKYLNGHSDVIGGVLTAASAELAEQFGWWANCLGTTGPAFDSYLTLRGLRTLHLRMRAHQENALAVAEALASHAGVERVYHPSRPDHPGHALAARQMDGFGAIVSAEIVGGEAGVAALLDGLASFSLAESLGGVESLICHPRTMTHAAMPPEVQDAAGLRPGLVRLSVGVEGADDLVADLTAGLDRAAAAAG